MKDSRRIGVAHRGRPAVLPVGRQRAVEIAGSERRSPAITQVTTARRRLRFLAPQAKTIRLGVQTCSSSESRDSRHTSA